MKKFLFILLLIAAAFAVWGILSYNKLVLAESGIAESWSRVEGFSRRQCELLPDLAATASRLLPEEDSTLVQDVIGARAEAVQFCLQDFSQPSIDRAQAVQDRTDKAVDALISALEEVPETAQDLHCTKLLDQIGRLGIQILNARMDFNRSTEAFNALARTFPANLAARFLHFGEKGRFATAVEIGEI